MLSNLQQWCLWFDWTNWNNCSISSIATFLYLCIQFDHSCRINSCISGFENKSQGDFTRNVACWERLLILVQVPHITSDLLRMSFRAQLIFNWDVMALMGSSALFPLPSRLVYIQNAQYLPDAPSVFVVSQVALTEDILCDCSRAQLTKIRSCTRYEQHWGIKVLVCLNFNS